jgi:metal-responsive CopG/Arc/MetJ family transcriptional regulator
MATDRARYTVSVDSEMFQQIEDFRFERRFNTRSEATVELLRIAIETLKKRPELLENLKKQKTIKVYRAAKSKDDRPDGWIEMTEERAKEFEDAPATDEEL